MRSAAGMRIPHAVYCQTCMANTAKIKVRAKKDAQEKEVNRKGGPLFVGGGCLTKVEPFYSNLKYFSS